MSKSNNELADFFAGMAHDARISPSNVPEEIYPGYPGMVLAGGALQSMTWGFPLNRKGAKGQPLKPKPVNNARSDKLGSPFWSSSFRDRRCLIPISEFAEADGPKGAKTRTWFSLPDAPIMAVGGFWRETDEWGAAYTMVMTDANAQISGLHDRMPVILSPQNWPIWLGDDPQAAFELCQAFQGAMHINRTQDSWVRRR